jgi:hypothetical protein
VNGVLVPACLNARASIFREGSICVLGLGETESAWYVGHYWPHCTNLGC